MLWNLLNIYSSYKQSIHHYSLCKAFCPKDCDISLSSATDEVLKLETPFLSDKLLLPDWKRHSITNLNVC